MIYILYNSFSNNGKGLQVSKTICKYLSSKKIDFQKHENQWPETIEKEVTIWLIGGDGTMNYFLNYYGILPNPIALFAGGTGNDFHWKLYGNISLEKQIDKVLNHAQEKLVDIAQCNGQLFVNSIGLGFDGEVLKGISSIRTIGGHLGYLIQVLKTIFKFKEPTFTIHYENGNTFISKCLLLHVANSSRTGGGFMISPTSQIDDRILELIYCTELKTLARLKYLPIIQKGKHMGLDCIHCVPIKEAEIECPQEIWYQIDGELNQASRFKINLKNDTVTFLI